MTWEDEDFTCPVCHTEDVVFPSGSPKSPVLIIGEMPGREEIRFSKPFVGATGELFKKELLHLGVDLKQFRVTNLWLHEPNGNDECLKYSATKAITEAKGKQAILLVGSDAVSYFTDHKVMDVTGLRVKSSLLSAPIIMACINPAEVFHGAIGELRLSLKKFVSAIGDLI